MSNILQMLLDCRKMMLITIIFTIIINTIAVETTTGNRISSMKDSPSLSNDSPLWRYLSSVPSDDLISIIKAIERNVTVDDSCRTSLERFRVAFERKEWWIAEWIDSFGRPESGLLTGNSFWTGNQFECERLPVMLAKHNQPRLMPIATSYCVIDIAFLSSDIDRNDSSLIVPKSNVRVGSCLPGQCSLEDLNQLYVELVKYVHTTNSTDQLIDTLRPLLLNETRLQCNLPSTLTNGWFTRLATAAFVLMFTASVLISCSSTVWFSQQSNENDDCDDSIETKWIAIFKSFDLVRNFNRLFSTAEPNKLAMTITPPQPKPSLNCLNGIRVLSIQWVMLAHVLSYSRPVIKNASQVIDTSNSVEIHLIGNAGFAVDTFFTLSGLLLSYHFFRRCDNRTYKWTPKSLGAFYVGRYVRLTVVYAVVLMFYLLIADQLASGPNWLAFQNEVSKCKHDFWKNLLYINNISSQYYDQCMVWTWYLANDFQFHLIAPLCLMFLQRRRWQAWLLFAGIVLFSWIINFYLSVVNQLTFPEPLDLSEQTAHKLSIYLTEIYQRPYCRIGPFLVGLLTGHFINRKVQRNFDGYSLTLLIIGHCLCLLGFTYSLFFTYIWRSTVLSYAIYLASSSIIWSASLCWLVFNCVTGQLKFIDRVLSLGSFRPLSRLTYCLYLVHLIVYMIYIYSLPTGLYMSGPIGLAIIMSGLCSVSILLSLPLVLFFEMPSTEIAKHLNSGR